MFCTFAVLTVCDVYNLINLLNAIIMKKYLAEAVGTMVLVLMGCGAAVSLGCNSADPAFASTVVGTSLAFGLAVVAMAYAIGITLF